MILPTKGIEEERALISLGADVLSVMHQPMTVSGLWDGVQAKWRADGRESRLGFDWFVLALDLLFIIGAVQVNGSILQRVVQDK